MMVKDAVAERFQKICNEKKIKLNELANISGVTPSSVYSLMDPKRRNVSIVLIKKLCDGLEISIKDFFSDDDFDLSLEQELK